MGVISASGRKCRAISFRMYLYVGCLCGKLPPVLALEPNTQRQKMILLDKDKYT